MFVVSLQSKDADDPSLYGPFHKRQTASEVCRLVNAAEQREREDYTIASVHPLWFLRGETPQDIAELIFRQYLKEEAEAYALDAMDRGEIPALGPRENDRRL